MNYSVGVPNAAQSPGLFPAQSNTNFLRLKSIINAEHNFTDGSATAEGIHKQCTFVNRDTPGGLPAGNGVLYSKADSLGASQLNWYNGASNIQLTPYQTLLPIRVVGSASVANNAFQTIFTNPGYSYTGSAWVGVQGGTIFLNVTPVRWVGGSNSIEEINHGSAGDDRVPITFSGNDLRVQNKVGSTQTLVWSLIINRLA